MSLSIQLWRPQLSKILGRTRASASRPGPLLADTYVAVQALMPYGPGKSPSSIGEHILLIIILHACPFKVPRSPAHLTDWPLWVRISLHAQNKYFAGWTLWVSKKHRALLWVYYEWGLPKHLMHLLCAGAIGIVFSYELCVKWLWVNPGS